MFDFFDQIRIQHNRNKLPNISNIISKIRLTYFYSKQSKNQPEYNLNTITSKSSPNNQMTRKILVAAFTLLCLCNNINGQKMYEKDPGFLSSLIGDPVPSNFREYMNDKVKKGKIQFLKQHGLKKLIEIKILNYH